MQRSCLNQTKHKTETESERNPAVTVSGTAFFSARQLYSVHTGSWRAVCHAKAVLNCSSVSVSAQDIKYIMDHCLLGNCGVAFHRYLLKTSITVGDSKGNIRKMQFN